MVVNPFDDDLVSLLETLSQSHWDISWWTNCSDAVEMLRGGISVPVVLCERNLPDGTWRTLMHQVLSLARPPSFIVAARFADDRLCGDALNMGAYDVLRKPFEEAELLHTIDSAWSRWQSEVGGTRLKS